MFCGWLTTQEEITKMGSAEECGCIVEKIQLFCDTNNLEEPRKKWNDKLVHPKSK